MERYVISRELAERLKAAGYKQSENGRPTTYFVWATWMEGESEVRAGKETYGKYIVAPLSDELLEHLPDWIKIADNATHEFVYFDGTSIVNIGGDYMLQGEKWDENDYAYRYLAVNDVGTLPGSSHHSDKPADALAKLWLYCKENGHIKEQPHDN